MPLLHAVERGNVPPGAGAPQFRILGHDVRVKDAVESDRLHTNKVRLAGAGRGDRDDRLCDNDLLWGVKCVEKLDSSGAGCRGIFCYCRSTRVAEKGCDAKKRKPIIQRNRNLQALYLPGDDQSGAGPSFSRCLGMVMNRKNLLVHDLATPLWVSREGWGHCGARRVIKMLVRMEPSEHPLE